MTPEAAARAIREDAYVYLDVRSVEEFELGHPEGAYNVPWVLRGAPAPNAAFSGVVAARFELGQGLIVGCQTGQRSAPASAALLAAGFARVVELQAGFAGRRDAFGRLIEAGWERSGLPTSTQARAGRSYRELCEGIPAGSGP